MILEIALAAALMTAPDARTKVDALIDANRGKTVDVLIQAGLPYYNDRREAPAKLFWVSKGAIPLKPKGCLKATGCSTGDPYYSSTTCVLEVQLDADGKIESHRWKGLPKACKVLAADLVSNHSRAVAGSGEQAGQRAKARP